MRRKFLKSDFHAPNADTPPEFEIKDYDDAQKTQKTTKPPVDMTPLPRSSNMEPAIKEEPTETTIPPPTETPAETPAGTQEPAAPKGSRMLKKLESNLDGKAWACTDTHKRRLRVRTTGIEEEDEYYDHWDNTVELEEETQENTIPADDKILEEE